MVFEAYKKIIIQKVKHLMDADLYDKYLKLVSINKNILSDAVTIVEPSGDSKRIFNYTSDKTREGYILNRIGHISANPSIPERKLILEKVFAYLCDDNGEPKLKDYLNYNKSNADLFMESLIKTSQDEIDIYNGEKNVPRSVFFLVGERGVGKTFFLNHLVSANSDQLDREKVIWVRINIARPFDGDLKHWLMSQAVFIILRYYYNKYRDFSDILSKIEKYIYEKINPDIEKLLYFQNLTKIKQQFIEKKAREVLTKNTVNENLAAVFIDEVIKMGYSFIYVIDGFDRYDIIPKDKAIFETIKHQLTLITDLDTRIGGCYVIVSRTQTEYYINPSGSAMVSSKEVNMIPKRIGAASFKAIFDKRITYLKENIPLIAKEKHWNTFDWENHLEHFREYLRKKFEAITEKDFYEKVEEPFGSNNRAKVQLMRMFYYEFLRDVKEEPKAYLLMEYMCRGGFEFPPRHYIYEIQEDKISPKKHTKIFDNIFMPIFFRFPYVKEYKYEKIPLAQTYLLAGLRIIQLSQGFAEINNDPTKIPANKLSDILLYFFNYDPMIIHGIIEEYSEFNFIKLRGNIVEYPREYGNMLLDITRKMNFIYQPGIGLTNRSVLSGIAYLNMCSMRVLINQDSLVGDKPFFKAISLEENRDTIIDWIIWKIINNISLFRIIKKINEIEKTAVGRKKKPQYRNVIKYFKFDKFITQLSDAIIAQIIGILNKTINEAIFKRLIKDLDIYENKWGTLQ